MQQQEPDAVQPDRQNDDRDDQQRLQPQHQSVRQQWPPRKRNDEGRQIKRQRHDPEQRRRGEVGGDVGGHREQQARRHEGVANPAQPFGDSRARRRLGHHRSGDHMAAVPDPTERNSECEQPQPERPVAALLPQWQGRLDDQRIGEQRQQAAGVAGGVQEVRVAGGGVIGARKPALQQGRRCRYREKGRPDGRRQPGDQPGNRAAFGGRQLRRQIERQEQRGESENCGMDRRLRQASETCRQPMRIGIAEQQHGLEKAHAGVPHVRRAAEMRQHHLADHRLHQEQQAGADEQRDRESGQQQRSGKSDRPDARRGLDVQAHGISRVLARPKLARFG